MIKVLVGNVRDCEQYRDIKGIKLLVTQIEDDKGLMIIGPIDYKEIEQFYRVSFETGLKDSISDDFDYCIWYLLVTDCEECEKQFAVKFKTTISFETEKSE